MPIEIHGKKYVMVNERIQTFNEKYKNGSIITEMTFVDDIVRCKAIITPDCDTLDRVFIGHAEELRGSTNINKTSAVENCETSAVGRALAMLGIGIIEAIASADEVIIAQNKASTSPKNDRYTTEQMAEIEKLGKEAKLTQAEVAQGIRKHYKVSITQLTKTQADGVITMLKKTITDKEEGKTV